MCPSNVDRSLPNQSLTMFVSFKKFPVYVYLNFNIINFSEGICCDMVAMSAAPKQKGVCLPSVTFPGFWIVHK